MSDLRFPIRHHRDTKAGEKASGHVAKGDRQ